MQKLFKSIKEKMQLIRNDLGSVVIEATISLTAFMFLVITLLVLINGCLVQARVAVALNESAKEFSEYGYVYSLFGFNKKQKDYYDGLVEYRMDIDDALTALGDAKQAIVNIASFRPGNGGNPWDTWNNSMDTLDNSAKTYRKIADNIKKDPASYFTGMLKVAGNEGIEFFKGAAAGQFIAKGLMHKHLKESINQDPDQFLRRHGVVDGMDGLSLWRSTIFTNGSDDIAFICTYDIEVVRLLNIDVKYNVCQLAKTKAWTGNALVREEEEPTDKSSNPGDSSSEGSTEESGPADSSEEGSTDEGGADDSSEEGSTDDSSDEGSSDDAGEGESKDPYDETRAKMVEKYGEDAVKAIEEEYGDEVKEWDNELWSIAAIIYAMDHNCPEILDEEERCEYEKEVNKKYGLCFVAGTQIKTPEGNKNIEDIEVGDEVYSYDYYDGKIAIKGVTELFVNEASNLVNVDIEGESIISTPSHPYYVSGVGFKEASELDVGDNLLLVDGSTEEIENISYINFESPVEVYNFSVEDWHTYYVSNTGVLVHNKCASAELERSKLEEAKRKKKTRLPRKNGGWDGEPGESTWYSDNPEVNEITGGEGVPFKDGRPDFSKWTADTLTFEKGKLDGTDQDFKVIYEKVQKEYNLDNVTEAKEFLKELGLTPHHKSATEIQLVPTKLHKNVPHIGSASDMRNGEG